jgi:hypothetical protein
MCLLVRPQLMNTLQLNTVLDYTLAAVGRIRLYVSKNNILVRAWEHPEAKHYLSLQAIRIQVYTVSNP